ncbi:MAG: M48 family metallopeptidase [Pseudomonadota bacterium]|nr:M48 family metallopeptidase [Pseudomonadota bacterium]
MQPEIRVRVRSPSLHKAGVVGALRFVGESLLIKGGVSLRVGAAQVSVTVGGFDDDLLFLSWQDAEGSWSASPVDAAAQQALLEHCPAALSSQMKLARKKIDVQHFKWNAVLTVVGMLVLTVVLTLWQLDRVERWLAGQVSLATEKRLGQMGLESLKSEGDLDQESAAAKAVSELGARLTQSSRYEYQWYIKNDDSINAFAMPGGIVVVHSGLIANAETPEQLAGVLAHEVQHVEQRHSLQHLIHAGGLAAVLAVTMGDVNGIAAVLLHSAGTTRHSRELEAQADADGVSALIAAGIPPQGMTEFFAKLMKQDKDRQGPAMIQFLSSHPATEARLATIQQHIEANPCQCAPLSIDWTAVQASIKENRSSAD